MSLHTTLLLPIQGEQVALEEQPTLEVQEQQGVLGLLVEAEFCL
jgi:hypothetical protein